METVTIIEHNDSFSYHMEYPKTKNVIIDQHISLIIKDIQNAFDKKYSKIQNISNENSSFANTTLLLRYEMHVFAVSHLSLVLFETHTHDNNSIFYKIHTYHFDLRQNEEQQAEDLMYRGFQESASIYARKYFQERASYRKDLFKNHAEILSVKNGLFSRFALTDDGVLFYFEPNLILPDNYGVIRLTIPYEDMQPNQNTTQIIKTNHSSKIDFQKPIVALTFDDGPNPIYTNLILDILEDYGAAATFFDLGNLIESFPSVSQREIALNCEVASHSYDHKKYLNLSFVQIIQDIKKTSKIFRKVLAQKPVLFRPPYGAYNRRIKMLVRIPFILWSVDSRDWESRNAEAIVKTVKEIGNLDGEVILMHSIYESTAKATAILIPYLLEEGYQLVTISQMLQLKYKEKPWYINHL